jgi:hypothetical protein
MTTPALTALRRALTQAASEPDDAVAIELGVDQSAQFTGVTWGDLRRVVHEAERTAAATVQPLHAIADDLDDLGSQVAAELVREYAHTITCEGLGATL